MHNQPVAHSGYASVSTAPFSGSVSLGLATLWPLTLVVLLMATAIGHNQIPEIMAVLTAMIFLVAPPVGIITGHIGWYQANHRAPLRALRWRALVGLIGNYLWLLSIFFISNLGPAVVYWLQHL